MKWFKLSIKILSGVVIAIAAIVAIASFYFSTEKEEYFYIEEAELLDPELFKNQYNLMLSGNEVKDEEIIHRVIGHRIKKGNGVILGYRGYSPGSLQAVDDEVYTKITFWLEGGFGENVVEINLSDNANVVAIYSRGGAAWPEGGCHGIIDKGKIKLNRLDGEIAVDINAEVKFIPDPVWKDEHKDCIASNLNGVFVLDRIKGTEINPWIGKKGEHIYDETYIQ